MRSILPESTTLHVKTDNLLYSSALLTSLIYYFTCRECASADCPVVQQKNSESSQQFKYCQNMCMQSRDFPPTEVFATPHCGYGLRLLRAVPGNTVIIEYLGEVITSTECFARMSEYTQSDDFYFASLGSGLFLDAKLMGSDARYANHSCDPNCDLQKWNVLGESRIALVSKRSIEIGEEITYNYQYFADEFEGSSLMQRQICKCGAKNCSGTIGGKVIVSQASIIRTKVESTLNGSRRQSRQTLEALRDTIREGIGDLNDRKELDDRIVELFRQADEWLLKYDDLFRSGGLIELQAVNDLMDCIPNIIYLEQISSLDTLCKKVSKAKKSIAKLKRSDDGLQQEADVNKMEENHFNNSYPIWTWEEFISVCKDILAALPVRCDGVNELVNAYLEINSWCKRYLLPIVPDSMQLQFKPPALSQCGLVEKMFRAYSFSELITTDLFVVSQCFEMRLNDFINRRKLETSEPNIESGKKFFGSCVDCIDQPPTEGELERCVRFICEKGDLFFTDISSALKQISTHGLLNKENSSNKKQTKRLKGEEDNNLLYCICRQPATIFAQLDRIASSSSSQGSSLLMMQCEVCKDWYHPNCINFTAILSSNAAVAKREKEKPFECPICAFVTRNDVTAFAFKSKVVMDCIDSSIRNGFNGTLSTNNTTSFSSNDEKKQPANGDDVAYKKARVNGSSSGDVTKTTLRYMTIEVLEEIIEKSKNLSISKVI